jgi:hypothetical protein
VDAEGSSSYAASLAVARDMHRVHHVGEDRQTVQDRGRTMTQDGTRMELWQRGVDQPPMGVTQLREVISELSPGSDVRPAPDPDELATRDHPGHLIATEAAGPKRTDKDHIVVHPDSRPDDDEPGRSPGTTYPPSVDNF